jgi:hypothetical protein
MKTQLIVIAFVVATFSTGCASSTVIRSFPAGATVKSRNGAVLGKTPYSYSDTEMNGHTESFVVEKDGFEESSVTIRRDKLNGGRAALSVGAGFFTLWGFAGLLWANDYDGEYQVHLEEKPKSVAVLTEDPAFDPAPYPSAPLVRAEQGARKKAKGRAR